MEKLENSEAMEYLLQTIIKVIGRRSNKKYAFDTLNKIIEQLKTKHDILQHVKMEGHLYSEDLYKINVNSQINNYEPSKIRESIREIIDILANSISISEHADYFFIREIRDDLENDHGESIEVFLDNLDLKGYEYLIGLKESKKTKIIEDKNSEIIKPVLNGLQICLNNIEIPDINVAKTITNSIKKIEEDYTFLKYIHIGAPDADDICKISTMSTIDDIPHSEIGEAIQKILVETGRSLNLKIRPLFLEKLKKSIEPTIISKIEKIGINFDEIDDELKKQGYELIFKETLKALITIIGEKTSTSFAVASIDTIFEEIKEKHKSVLRHVEIDKSRYDEGVNSINISSEINSENTYEIGKTISDTLRKIVENLIDKKSFFVEDFKNKLGLEFVSEIETIGVNLHLLELRYS